MYSKTPPIRCPMHEVKERHSIPRCKIRQKIREIGRLPLSFYIYYVIRS